MLLYLKDIKLIDEIYRRYLHNSMIRTFLNFKKIYILNSINSDY